jgi:hypothetical protein
MWAGAGGPHNMCQHANMPTCCSSARRTDKIVFLETTHRAAMHGGRQEFWEGLWKERGGGAGGWSAGLVGWLFQQRQRRAGGIDCQWKWRPSVPLRDQERKGANTVAAASPDLRPQKELILGIEQKMSPRNPHMAPYFCLAVGRFEGPCFGRKNQKQKQTTTTTKPRPRFTSPSGNQTRRCQIARALKNTSPGIIWGKALIEK